ncbi:hypothetical protein NQZ68_005410 [Dissostichus eleginoides]|nr:hypothetical protein NQZ68_005410 [Dissostichus eleginoides]
MYASSRIFISLEEQNKQGPGVEQSACSQFEVPAVTEAFIRRQCRGLGNWGHSNGNAQISCGGWTQSLHCMWEYCGDGSKKGESRQSSYLWKAGCNKSALAQETV